MLSTLTAVKGVGVPLILGDQNLDLTVSIRSSGEATVLVEGEVSFGTVVVVTLSDLKLLFTAVFDAVESVLKLIVYESVTSKLAGLATNATSSGGLTGCAGHIVTCCRKDNIHSVGELSTSLICPNLLTVLTVPILDVTVLGTRRSNSLNVDSCGIVSCGKNYVLNVGKLSKSLICPNLLTLVADPVLDLTVIVTAGLDSFVMYKKVAALCRDNYVLNIGDLSKSLVSPYSLTTVADPILGVTGVVAACLNSVHMNEVGVACGNDYVHSVGKLSTSLILPYLTALLAVPVLDVTILVTGSGLSLNVDSCGIVGCAKNYVLNVGKLSKSLIGPNLLTGVADPILNVTVVVATGLNCIEVMEIALAGSGNDYVLNVGDKSKSLIGPYGLTIVAVPILNVTGVVATGSNCLEVLEVSVVSAKLNSHHIGKLGESLILPYLHTLFAVPVLDVTIGATGGSYCFNVYNVTAYSGIDYALDIGELSKSCVSPNLLTLVADPVLDLTVIVTAGLDSFTMYKKVAALSGKSNVLDIGKLSKSLILPYLFTLVADPVLDAAVVVATCLNSRHMYNVALAGSGKNYILDVGKLSESLILPYLLTSIAYPVLDVTVVVTTGSNCIEVLKIALTGSGKDSSLNRNNLSESLIGPSCITLGAVPVLDVTFVVASGSECINVLNVVCVRTILNTTYFTVLGVVTGSIYPLVTKSFALGFATNLTGLGSCAGSVFPYVTKSGALVSDGVGCVTTVTLSSLGTVCGTSCVAVGNIIGECVTKSCAVCLSTYGTGLSGIAGSCSPLVTKRCALRLLTNGTGLGGVTGSVYPFVTKSCALCLRTNGTCLGSVAGSIRPIVAECFAFGRAASLTSLSRLASSFRPCVLMKADHNFNLHLEVLKLAAYGLREHITRSECEQKDQ